LAPELVASIGARARAQGVAFYVMYGQTEATARIAYMPPERLAEDPYGIGGPIPGGELWIEDERGRRLPALSEGELTYRGPNVMMGYALSRDDLAAPAGSDILHTGDLAVQAAGGSFRITGRKSRFVKPFGLRIGLDELEERARRAGSDVVFSGDDNLVVALGRAGDEQGVREGFMALGLPGHLLEYVAHPNRPQLRGGKTWPRSRTTTVDWRRARR
jgi:long-subunit acyl-CoA synthetase (AMP-forming)